MRLNRQYRREARAQLVTAAEEGGYLHGHYARHAVLVFVDRLDLAVIRALRYAGSLRPTEMRAVHLLIDRTSPRNSRPSGWRGDWDRVPLQVVECSDRRLVRAAGEVALGMVSRTGPR